MNTRQTWWLVGVACALALYIGLVERGNDERAAAAQSTALVPNFQRDRVMAIEITQTNQPPIRLTKSGPLWELVAPLHYPAQSYAAERWLQLLEQANWVVRMSEEDVASQGATLAEFGLQPPQMTVTLQQADRQTVVRMGNRLAVGKQFYVQVDDQPDIFITDSQLLEALPDTATAWRTRALVTFASLFKTRETPDRFEVRPKDEGYSLQSDPPNGWRITSPISARGDPIRIGQFVENTIPRWQVEEFVTDDPNADLAPYGLLNPTRQLAIGRGTNDLLVVQFGASPTNRPDLVYARMLRYTNIVLTASTNMDWLRVKAAYWRDHLLTHMDPDRVQEIVGSYTFASTNATYRLRQQTNGTWQVVEPELLSADPGLVTNFFTILNSIEVDFERDIVSDFAPYGLADPARQFSFLSATNGKLTNVYTTLSFGTNGTGGAFARRADEKTVYSIQPDVFFNRLPLAHWQWRDRTIWNFKTNEVRRVIITQNGKTREVLRTTDGHWELAPGSTGVLDLSFDEAVYQMGSLKADRWVWAGNGDLGRKEFEFNTNNPDRLAFEVIQKGVVKTNVVEFGGANSELKPYAAVQFGDDRTWFFEFPPVLYYQYVKHNFVIPAKL